MSGTWTRPGTGSAGRYIGGDPLLVGLTGVPVEEPRTERRSGPPGLTYARAVEGSSAGAAVSRGWFAGGSAIDRFAAVSSLPIGGAFVVARGSGVEPVGDGCAVL